MNYEYIIIGGGVIGMATARELALRGSVVAIFDKGELGKEASWSAGGILSSMRPWAEHPASAELSEQGKRLYPGYVESLKDETGIDSEYFRSGLMIIDKVHVEKTKAWAKALRIDLQENITDKVYDFKLPEQSVSLPEIAQIRPPRLIKALKESLKQLPVSIYENTEITNISVKDNQFSHVEFKCGKTYADAVIVTAGAWSTSVLKSITNQIDIKPMHGQMLCVKPTEQKLHTMVLDDAHYLIPRQDGQVLIGSTMEDFGFIKKTTPNARKELLDWSQSLWPELVNAKIVSHWSGLRPSSEGGKPIIGPIAELEGIYVNAGHFRKGILQAPASAKLLADYLSDKNSFMPIELFNIENQRKSLEFPQ